MRRLAGVAVWSLWAMACLACLGGCGALPPPRQCVASLEAQLGHTLGACLTLGVGRLLGAPVSSTQCVDSALGLVEQVVPECVPPRGPT